MNSKIKAIRQLLPIFFSLLILLEVFAYTTTITPPGQKYFQLYALGSTGSANNYFPNNSPSIRLGQAVIWQLAVVNDMGLVQFVAVLVKLGNQSTVAPNDTLGLPSAAPFVAEFKQVMQNNATWNINFEWRVTNFTTTPDGYLRSVDFSIDNITYLVESPPSCSLRSCNLRLIFELWTWNTDSADFQIGWWNGSQHRIAWLQLWFNLTPVAR